jgi:glycosyltransferase involved in cell wall biosynthesis
MRSFASSDLMEPSMSRNVSFIIPCLNEGDNLRKTIESLIASNPPDFEIVVVDNGSTDGCTDFLAGNNGGSNVRLFRTESPLGVGGARNFGAAFAEGEFLIFMDAHVLSPMDWHRPVLELVKRREVGIVAPAVRAWDDSDARGYGMYWTDSSMGVDWLGWKSSTPYVVPLVAGLCQAFRWDFFHEIGGYDTGMKGYGHEDLEICLRTWLLDYQVYLIPDVEVSHLFRGTPPYSVTWEEVLYNQLRLIYSHFNLGRIERILGHLQALPGFAEAVRRLNTSDIWTKRRSLEVKRRHDDDWFCTSFGLDL